MLRFLSRASFKKKKASRNSDSAHTSWARFLRPALERLEDRVVPAAILWDSANRPTGGDWNTAANWVGGAVPTASDTVTINLTGAGTVTHNTGVNDSVNSLATNSLTTLNLGNGSLTLGPANSTFGGPVVVGAPATLTLQSGAGLTIASNQTVTVNGTMNLGAGDTVTLTRAFGVTTQIAVNGTLNATSTSFVVAGSGGSSTMRVLVNSGGRLTSTNSTIALDQVYWDNGSVLGNGDISANRFDCALFVPAGHIPFLSGGANDNRRFQDINLLTGSLNSGSLALNPIGTETNVNIRYVFPGAFTVQSGATLSVGANVPVLLQTAQTVTVNGTMNLTGGNTVTLTRTFGVTTQIAVNGTLNAASSSFVVAGSGGSSLMKLAVNSGGRLTSTNSTFAIDQVTWDNSSLLSSGNLSGNRFDTAVFLPVTHIPFLSGGANDNRRFQDINLIAGSLNSGTVALNAMGTETNVSLRYVFPGAFTVQADATLSVGANVPVLLQAGQTVTVNGTMSLAGGNTVTLTRTFGVTTQILVNGTLDAEFTSFVVVGSGGSSLMRLAINSGGRFRSSNGTFAIDQIAWDNSSLLSDGNLSGNRFDSPIFLPVTHIPFLSGGASDNRRFQDINLIAGSLNSGTVALNAMGTETNVSLRYVFPGAFTVQSGATLAVGANVPVLLQAGQTVTVNGTMSLAGGNTVTLTRTFGVTTQVLVNGTLNATSTTFNIVGSGGSSLMKLAINSGGRFTSTNGTFALDQVVWDNSSLLSDGNLSSNRFDSPIFIPITHIPFFSGGANDNRRFQDINLVAGSLNSGNLALNAIGTETNVNLRYVFPGAFTVQTGASLSVGANVPVLLQAGQTVTVNGTMNLTGGNTVTLTRSFGATTQIVVNGTLNAVSTSLVVVGSGGSSLMRLAVNSGGRFTSTNGTFAVDQIYWDNGSLLGDGNLSGNRFDMPIFLPASHIPFLSGGSNDNRRFQDVNIIAGILNSGSLTLGLLGTETNVNLRYVFAGAFTVQSTAVVTVAANVAMVLQAGQTLTVNGAMSLASGDAFTFVRTFGVTTQMVVTGTLTANNAAFAVSGSGGSSLMRIQVNNNGRFTANAGSIALDNVTLLSGSTATWNNLIYSGQLLVDSGAAVSIAGNDLTNISASGLIASGDPNAAIDFRGNYWGTTVTGQIAAKIKDKTTDNSRPTILYQPFIAGPGTTLSVQASTTFKTTSQTVALSATVTSPAGTVNEGTETFTVLNGSVIIGAPVVVNVVAGAAATNYTLPAGTPAGQYVIQASYSGSANFLASTDSSKFLIVNPAATTTAAANAAATFNAFSGQNIALSATVGSAAGTVNEGTATFTLQSGLTTIGTPVTVVVANGAAGANYILPAGTAGGSYTIKVVFNGSNNFTNSSDASRVLTVASASSSTAASNAAISYSASAQTLALAATIVSAAGIVSEGTTTFTVLNGATPVGTATTVFAVNGVSTANYLLPAGTSAGSYTIRAVFNGTGNYSGSTDTSRTLTVNAVSSTTNGANASTGFNTVAQVVPLTAAVTSSAGVVNEGTATFTILAGVTAVGTPITANVATGTVSANYSLPAGAAAGSYTIRVDFNGSTNFQSSSDASRTLTIGAVNATTSAANAAAVFSRAPQNISLTATVTSPGGIVNEGTETFTIFNGLVPVGTPVTAAVVNGAASVSYTLPADMAPGSYTIQAVYNGTSNFGGATDATHTLVVAIAPSTVVAASAAATYKRVAQNVALTATVSSPGGGVDEGTATFTLLSGAAVLGTPSTVAVSGGVANANYTLPAGTSIGSYTIQVAFNGTAQFLSATDSTRLLTLAAAATTTTGTNATAPFSTGSQTVTLSADVSSAAGQVNEGSLTFTVMNGAATVGSPVTTLVVNGSASVAYALPAGLAPGAYILTIAFANATNFSASSDAARSLVVSVGGTTIGSADVTTIFAVAAQSVSLSATLASPAGIVNEGTVTFTILQGANIIGTPTTAAVTNGSAMASYALPPGVGAGAYTIKVEYGGTANFAPASDSSRSLTVGSASTTAAAANVSATFNASAQSLAFSATVTSARGTVNEGTATFTLLSGSQTIGTPVTVNVVNGLANANYSVPTATAGGTYTIQVKFNGTNNFASSSDSTRTLTVLPAATTSAANDAAAIYSTSTQTLSLSASVSSQAGSVGGGAATFTILNGATIVGTPVSTTVANGAASVSYALPAAAVAGSYTLRFVYAGNSNFAGSSDETHVLTIAKATTTIDAANVSATFSAGGQSLTLLASINSAAGPVNEGTTTFTILNGATPIGTGVSATPTNGVATASYLLPAGTPAGSYTLRAVYAGSTNLVSSTDASHSLTIARAATTTTAANVAATFNESSRLVSFSALVASPAGVVEEGTATFTLMNGANPIGTPVTVNVAAGSANANYIVPGGLAPGSYAIATTYSGSGNLLGSADNSRLLTLSVGGVAISASNALLSYKDVAQTVRLSAGVTSSAGAVNEGQATFTLLIGTNAVGSPVTADVVGGAVSVDYILPGGTPVGVYTIQAVYSGGANFGSAADSTHSLTLGIALTTTTLVTDHPVGSTYGETVKITAGVTALGSTPTGTVQFQVDSVNLGSPVALISGKAIVFIATMPAGSRSITAVYVSNVPSFAGSTGAIASFAVAKAPLTVTANNSSRLFGQPNPAFEATVSGFVNGESQSVLGGALNFTTPATTTSPAGTHAITPAGLTASNYAISFVDGTLTIAKNTLTVTASNATKVYGQANPSFAAVFSGFVNGDGPGALGGSLTFSTSATATSPVGSYIVTPGGLTSTNYVVSFVSGNLSITQAALTVMANNASKAHGQPNPSFSATFSGFQGSDGPGSLAGTLTFSTSATASSSVGIYAITPSGLTSTDYSITFADGTLTVTPAALAVTAINATKLFGQPNPSFSVSYVGFAAGEGPSDLGGALSISSTATALSPVGTYAIVPGGLTSANYTIAFVNGTLVIQPVGLAFSDLSGPVITQGMASVTLSGRLSGGTTAVPFGENITIAINNVSQTATLDANGNFTTFFNTANLTAAGSPFTITYAYAGNANFDPRSDSTKTLVVQPPPVSAVAALPAFSPISFLVNWSGTDAGGPGLDAFDILVSDNGGPFTPWLVATRQISATFDRGVNGHTYGFASVAIDTRGGRQAAPQSPHAVTRVDGVAPQSSARLAAGTAPELAIPLEWTGSDDLGGSGVAAYELFVSDNGAPFAIHPTAPTAQSIEFVGQYGHEYRFFTLARDVVGNKEAQKSTAEVSVRLLPKYTATGVSLDAIRGVLLNGSGLGSFTTSDAGAQAGGFSVSINWGDGTPADVASGRITFDAQAKRFLVSGSHTYQTTGNFSIVVSITDPFGSPASIASTAKVVFPRPTARPGGPYVIDNGQTLSLDGSTSSSPDSGDPIAAFAWDLNNDGKFDDAVGAKPTLNNAALAQLGLGTAPLTRTATLRITTESGLVDTASTSLTIRGTTTTTITANAAAVNPGQSVTFTVTVTSPDPGALGGTVAIKDGATSLGTVTLAGGKGTVLASFAQVGIHEVRAEFSGSSTFAPSAGNVSITVRQPSVGQRLQFSAATYSASEADGKVNVQVNRQGGSDGFATVQYALAASAGLASRFQATPNADFQFASIGILAFAPGESSKQLAIPIVNDQFVEAATESFQLTLSGPVGATLDAITIARVDIQDDDLPNVPNSTPNPATLQAAGALIGKSTEHYNDFVTKAYARFLGRAPDVVGLNYWVGLMRLYETSNHTQGLRQEQIEAGFIDSPEYLGRFGGVGEAWIRGIYRDLLGREADPTGVQYWLTQLQANVSPTNVALGFTTSDERLTNRVSDTYFTLLGRAADATGLAFWIGVFKSGGTTEDINSGFVGSAEYYNKPNGAAGNPARWVREAYLDTLFRPARTDEVGFWINYLRG